MQRKICAAVVFSALIATASGSEPPAVAGFAPPPPVKGSRYSPGVPGRAYDSAKFTQSIFVLDERDTIRPIAIATLPDKRWHQPGGLEGIKGWRSERYRHLPENARVKTWVGNIEVENSLKYKQHNRGILRSYPNGTRFDELLINDDTGRVFEHRSRFKIDGTWKSAIEFKDEQARPEGYTGLTVSCSSCHAEAGTGKYDAGLVPGGDTVLSDPLDWSVWQRNSPEAK